MLPEIDVQSDQASAIPFLRKGKQLKFCLITSIKRGNWGFPKGNVDPGLTVVEAALQEAYEEAGLHGRILGDPLGVYPHQKRNAKVVIVAVFLMEVERIDDEWLERDARERRWVSPAQALELVQRDAVKELLRDAIQILSSGT